MKKKFSVLLSFAASLMLTGSILSGCANMQTGKKTDRAAMSPAVAKHITADNPYKDVKVIDKFGQWPEKEGTPYYSSKVGTWFTVWWTAKGVKTFDHWTDRGWTRLKPVDYGYYSSGDEDYLTHVFLRLNYMGIDFIALDDTNGHWNDYGYIAENMKSIYEVADRLGPLSPEVAVCSGGPLRENDIEEQRRELDAYYNKFVKKHPGAYFDWKGKPLVIMYLAGSAGQRIEDDRFTIRYGTGYATWQNLTKDTEVFKTKGNWAWVFDLQNPGSEVMGAQPGYNKIHQRMEAPDPAQNVKTVERKTGAHYIEQWLQAIKEEPEVILIPSYNDHAEETGWEATVPVRPAPPFAAQDVPGEDPYLYEKITEGYLALRYGFIDGFHYRIEGTTQVKVFENGRLKNVAEPDPLKEPVIVLPKDYLKWYNQRSA